MSTEIRESDFSKDLFNILWLDDFSAKVKNVKGLSHSQTNFP